MRSLNLHVAPVHPMVIGSAIDAEMIELEFLRIGQLVDRMPTFTDYEPDNLITYAEARTKVLVSDGCADAAIT